MTMLPEIKNELRTLFAGSFKRASTGSKTIGVTTEAKSLRNEHGYT
jgi:hypothetical protein